MEVDRIRRDQMTRTSKNRDSRRVVGVIATACILTSATSSAFARSPPAQDPHGASSLAPDREEPVAFPAAVGAVAALGYAVYLLGEAAYQKGYENGQQNAQVEDLKHQVQGTITAPPRGAGIGGDPDILLD